MQLNPVTSPRFGLSMLCVSAASSCQAHLTQQAEQLEKDVADACAREHMAKAKLDRATRDNQRLTALVQVRHGGCCETSFDNGWSFRAALVVGHRNRSLSRHCILPV